MSGWLDQAAVLEPMKIVLPRSSGRASASRTQRNAPRTSVCQKTENVSQLWRRVGRCGPVAPALSTRTRGRSRSITRAAVTGSVASTTAVWSRRSSTALLHPRVAAVDEEAAARAARLAVPALEPAAAVGARPQVLLGVGLLWDLLHRARRLPTARGRRDQAGSAFACAMAPSQRALGLGLRACVVRSTATRPKVGR